MFLLRNANGDVQIATREALMRINVSFLLLVIFYPTCLVSIKVLLFVFHFGACFVFL